MARRLEDEISELKSEAARATGRTQRKPRAQTEAAATETVAKPSDDVLENLEELSEKLSDLVSNAEDEIRAHPVAITLGAFALGIVVGAMIKR